MSASSDDSLTIQLKLLAIGKGAAIVGAADLGTFFPESPNGRVFAIVFGMRYPDAAVELLPDDSALWNALQGLSERTQAMYADIVASICDRAPLAQCCRLDEAESNFGQMSVPLSQKAMAVLAGLGWIGKASLLVTPAHGPRLRLGTLLTDAPLTAGEPYRVNPCGACRTCQEACPVGAITGEPVRFEGLAGYHIDRQTCIEHLSRNERSIHRREFCGMCLKACPVGRANREAGVSRSVGPSAL